MRVLSFDVGLRNLAWCDLDQKPLNGETPSSFEILSWKVESAVEETTNVNETSIEVLVPSFVKLMQKEFQDFDFALQDNVLIESQPMGHGRSFGGTSFGGSPRNLKTKVLSHIIQTFFLQKNVSFDKIHFISPMLKLKECEIPFRERSYKTNKKQAIEKTAQLIGERWNDLQVGTKRDDLADAFLQGYMVCVCACNGSMKLEPSKVSKKKEKSISKKKELVTNEKTKPISRKRKADSSEELAEVPAKPKKRVTKKQRTEAIAADFV